MWHEDRLRPLAAALTNLVLNLILVQFIGIYGILLSTVLAILCVGMPWLLHNLFTVIFDKKYLRPYLKKLLFYCLIVFISCVVTYFICNRFFMGLITTLMVRLLICMIIPNVIYFLVYHKMDEYQQTLVLVDHMTKGKAKQILKIAGLKG